MNRKITACKKTKNCNFSKAIAKGKSNMNCEVKTKNTIAITKYPE